MMPALAYGEKTECAECRFSDSKTPYLNLWRFPMGFMNSYQRLDNLCRDMNGIGVTGYIKDMESIANRAGNISAWKNDYYKLKHYRYIRNQIAHENYADEGNMCSAEDVVWLEDFYRRIMTQRDPLSLYYKTGHRSPSAKAFLPKAYKDKQPPPEGSYIGRSEDRSAGCVASVLLSAAGVVFVIVLVLFLLS